MAKPKMLVALDEGVVRNFIGEDEQAHHRAEAVLQSALRWRIDNPTVEQEFEDEKRELEDGLLVLTHDLQAGEFQAGYIDEDDDYLIMLGPNYEMHTTQYPGTDTTQLTIKKRKKD